MRRNPRVTYEEVKCVAMFGYKGVLLREYAQTRRDQFGTLRSFLQHFTRHKNLAITLDISLDDGDKMCFWVLLNGIRAANPGKH